MTLKSILIDSREPTWVQKLTFGAVSVSVAPLTAGDAWLATEDAVIIVERKTFSDLLGSIQDGRLFDQAARMVKLSPWCYLMVQGWGHFSAGERYIMVQGWGHFSAGERYIAHAHLPKPWLAHRIEGALATIQQMGVVVIRIGEQQPIYRDALSWLADRKRSDVKIIPRREAVMQSPGERILCSLPGVHEVRALALLDHCGTAAWALVYLAGEGGGKVHGVGPAMKEATRQAMGLEDDQILAINIKEVTNE